MQGQLPKDKTLCLEDFLDERDYVGAAAFVNFQQKDGSSDDQALDWLAYVHYHNWEHAQVLLVDFEPPCCLRPLRLCVFGYKDSPCRFGDDTGPN